MDGWMDKCTWIAMHVDGWMDGWDKEITFESKRAKRSLIYLNAAFKI